MAALLEEVDDLALAKAHEGALAVRGPRGAARGDAAHARLPLADEGPHLEDLDVEHPLDGRADLDRVRRGAHLEAVGVAPRGGVHRILGDGGPVDDGVGVAHGYFFSFGGAAFGDAAFGDAAFGVAALPAAFGADFRGAV